MMKSLQDTDNTPLNRDEEKVEGLIRNHFIRNEQGREVEE